MKGKEKAEELLKKYGKKDNLILGALLGVLLMVIAWPINKEQNTSDSYGNSLGEVGTANPEEHLNSIDNPTMENRTMGEFYRNDYVETLENRVEELLEEIEGVGQVEVMITLSQSESVVVLKDTEISQGENNLQSSESTVFYVDEQGREIPYCVTTTVPVVEGVVVVAQGGDDPQRIIIITDVIQSLFDIPVHKIRVVKMKS